MLQKELETAIALARLASAEALGMSYREYTAIILDTGVRL